jgi:membrane protease subunit HflK
LPKSRGRAARILEEARGYKSKVISKSEGEASRFKKILTEYQKAPEVTKERLYRETMEEVFANTSKVVVDSKANNMMVLPIDKLLDTKVRTNNTMTQGVQSQQVKQDGSIRNVFRNREVR